MRSKKIFISYASEDHEKARRLYKELKYLGHKPWLDKESLFPGQNWETVILEEIRNCDFFLVLLSLSATKKKGFINKEIKEALNILEQLPESHIFTIPIRLDECSVTYEQLRSVHYVDFFPDWHAGFERLSHTLNSEIKEKYQNSNYPDLKKLDWNKEARCEEWPVYQVAFLWYGFEPPTIRDHWALMNRDIQDMKHLLHNSINDGKLKTSRISLNQNGKIICKYVGRRNLIEFANSRGEKPDFLFL